MFKSKSQQPVNGLSERCQTLLNALMEWVCSAEFAVEMSLARDLYALTTGKVNDEDPFYESRMAAFLEFFLFDYRLLDILPGSTLLECYLNRKQSIKVDKTLIDIECLRSASQSLFIAKNIQNNSVTVYDIIRKNKRVIHGLPDVQFTGIDPRIVFSGRTIRYHSQEYFTNCFVFHPVECTSIINKHTELFMKVTCRKQISQIINWTGEKSKMETLLSSSEKRLAVLEKSQKIKSIELLKATGQLASLASIMDQKHLVMALGQASMNNPYVPEAPLYETSALINKLAYAEVKSHRYKHIGPLKVYEGELTQLNTLN